MKSIFSLAILIITVPFLANAADQYATDYSCFNKAQLSGAPEVSVVQNVKNARFVKIENRGVISYVSLKLKRAGTGVSEYKGKSVSFSIPERSPEKASVTLDDLELTYNCKIATEE